MNVKRKRNIVQIPVHPTTLQMPLPVPLQSISSTHGIYSARENRTRGSERRPVVGKNQESGILLDGFMLLDCCRVEFPDEVVQAVLSGLEITGVVAEDLLFFSSLTRLDISDNEAPLEPFGCLPQLIELDIQCNALQHVTVSPNSFLNLEVINLSFNCLTTQDVEELSKLLRIRELYLGSNWIRSLPPVMDRFTKLETLSLEHNSLSGPEVFNLLALMPRLRNLNLGHNKIPAFPESALFADSKRGAGFYNLVYLNLAHNKLAEEDDVIFTAELHSLRKLVLYGNPLAHAAVASHDQTKLNYDPVPALTDYIGQSGKELSVTVAYPDTKKKRNEAATYGNVEIYKMLPNETALPSPFRSRGACPSELPTEKPKQSKSTSQSPRKRVLVDSSDTTFLTGVGIEDVLTPSTRQDVFAELPGVPATIITRSLQSSKSNNPLKARAAINALRFQLEHPLTSHDDSDVFPMSSQRPTQAQIHRQLPRRPLQPERRRSQCASPSPQDKQFSLSPSPFHPLDGPRAIDDALTQLSNQVAKSWDRLPLRGSTGSREMGRAVDLLATTTAHKIS